MSAKTQELTRSNQTKYSVVFCDECKYESQENLPNRLMSAIEAQDLADFHNECHHSELVG